MGLSIKLFALSFITLMLNGWYTDVTFKGDKVQEELIMEDLIEYNLGTKEGRVVTQYGNGSSLAKGYHPFEFTPKLSGQFQSTGIVYYSTRCVLLADNNKSRKRCDTTKSNASNFILAWNRHTLGGYNGFN